MPNRCSGGAEIKQEKCDVLVVGAGMGGLCAAALLAHAGYKTLLVEKLPFVGGRSSTMEYRGFKLTTGAVEIEMDGPVASVFKEVGVKVEVRPVVGPIHFRIGGKDYQLPERGRVRALLSTVADEAETQRIMSVLRRAFDWIEPPDTISAREWLCQYTNNEGILGIFNAMIRGLNGHNINEIPAGVLLRYFKRERYPYGFPPQGNVSLMEALAKKGKYWTRCRAKRIMVADGVVKGAIVEKDSEEFEITAGAVISDVGPGKTIELAGSENFDRGYLRLVEEMVRPVPHIWVQFASERPLIEYSGGLVLTQARRVHAILCPTLTCPELAPPGKHLMMAGSVLASAITPLNIQRELELTIQDLRDNLPGFDKYAEILVATCFHGDWPLFHAPTSSELPQKTPVENLYNVGDGVMIPGTDGLRACAQNARVVAEDIKKRFQPAGA